MLHRVRSVAALPDFKLCVQFGDGHVRVYDVRPLFDRIPCFGYLREHPEEFACVRVDTGGYGIVWNEELDLSCEELWEHGLAD